MFVYVVVLSIWNFDWLYELLRLRRTFHASVVRFALMPANMLLNDCCDSPFRNPFPETLKVQKFHLSFAGAALVVPAAGAEYETESRLPSAPRAACGRSSWPITRSSDRRMMSLASLGFDVKVRVSTLPA